MTQIQQKRDAKDLRPRATAMAVAASLLLLGLIGRLYQLQIIRGEEFSQKSRENYIKELVEPSARGLILDRRGRLIADNRPSFDIYITPAACKHPAEILARLGNMLAMPPEKIDAVLQRVKAAHGYDKFKAELVDLDVTRDQLEEVEADLSQLEGVDVIPSAHRSYLYGEELSHVVGYMSEVSQTELDTSKGKYRRGDFVGRQGIERTMEKELRGVDGRRRIAVDAKSRELDQEMADLLIPESERVVPSRPGNNVVLSIDLVLQHIATLALQEAGKAGAVVAVDVHTGFILAMVSEPGYDPNKLTGRISRKDLESIVDDPLTPLFQRDVQQYYHPGSTFKIVTALAALDRNVVTPESTTGCNGGYTLGSRRWRCWSDKGHGVVSLRRALTQSCDTYFYWLADKMGLDPIAEMGEKLGFGHLTGIELPSETAGVMPTQAFHDRVDHGYTKGFALNAAIGQGAVNVTPLQLAMAYAALANGGTLYKPHLVMKVEDADGKKVLRQVTPEVVRKIDIKPANLSAIMDGLIGVMNTPGGTGYGKRLADIKIAGKTGTAQNVLIGEKRVKATDMEWAQRDHAWFASIAPAENPEIVVVVINEHGGHGGSAAAPVAMAVIQAYFDYKNKPPLSQQEILDLKPNPRYAGAVVAQRDTPPPHTLDEPGRVQTLPIDARTGPGDEDEAAAPSDEVADPVRLAPKRRSGDDDRAGSTGDRPGAE